MDKPIGVMDSGVGGLTVAKEIMRQLPNERIYYLGDVGRCPYGPRDQEEVKQFTIEMASFLTQFDIKMLVIACNTATSVLIFNHSLIIYVMCKTSPFAKNLCLGSGV